MTENQNIPWKRIFVEAAAIVGSILLAFAIDAWWNDRQDREEEQVILLSLHEELIGIEVYWPWLDQYIGAINESAKYLLASAVDGNQTLGEREFDRLLADLTWFVMVTDLDVPVLESLVLSGDLSLIVDGRLRQKLRVWKGGHDSLRQRLRHQQQFFDNRIMPYLDKNVSIQQIYNVAGQMPGFPEDTFPQHKIDLSSLTSHLHLLADQEFQNLLTRRIEENTTLLENRSEEYHLELRGLIEFVEKELAK